VVRTVADRAPVVGSPIHQATEGGCRAAIITAVNQTADGVLVDVTQFTPAGGTVPFVHLTYGTAPGQWHYLDED